ncbi:MAG: hypothetical protein HN742_22300 [Lentisphaerae bacterium]|jgi:tRNA A-37 threonylcarbamoyl transferase component Bud32|nr:hypothetical protein [Lentisphaerota bacterium]MBT4814824.1 hypothetical protein [Lentisphaerota bacterium]MBT5604969.1 hypothetical protein [Lentisphaerota bacterium]MBT7055963.1 hypothetical protein [Lentisphaerota bacterium]MBT7844625.1 hypothetical protein [Lentisphaerota bacterium]
MRISQAIQDALTAQGAASGTRWLLQSEAWRPMAEGVSRHIAGVPSGLTVTQLKLEKNRDIFRCSTTDRTCVAKTFPMKSLKQRLSRYRRYGPLEAANLIEARRRGINAPEVHGFGWRSRGPLIYRTIVLMEDLGSHVTLSSLVGGADSTTPRGSLLETIADLLLDLYRAGCNHIDLNPNNILISPEDGDVRVIDFMYASYLAGPSTTVLAFHVAYLSDGLARCGLPEGDITEWAQRLLAGAGCSQDLWPLYSTFRQQRLSREERLRLI